MTKKKKGSYHTGSNLAKGLPHKDVSVLSPLSVRVVKVLGDFPHTSVPALNESPLRNVQIIGIQTVNVLCMITMNKDDIRLLMDSPNSKIITKLHLVTETALT